MVAARIVRISLDPDQSFDEFFTRSSAKLMRSAFLLTGNRTDGFWLIQLCAIPAVILIRSAPKLFPGAMITPGVVPFVVGSRSGAAARY